MKVVITSDAGGWSEADVPAGPVTQTRFPAQIIRAPAERYPSRGACIYCGTADGLTDEHIIPDSLAGHLVMEEASCKLCARKTARVEELCSRTMLGVTRYKLNFPSKRSKIKRPKSLPLHLLRHNGEPFSVQAPLADHPRSVVMPVFLPPKMLGGKARGSTWEGGIWMNADPDETAAAHKKYNAKGVRLAPMNPSIFAKMLAKIAHSYACAKMEPNYSPALLEFIQNDSLHDPVFVGGGGSLATNVRENLLHAISLKITSVAGVGAVLHCQIQLFSFFDAPIYDVVVGVRPTDGYALRMR